MHILPASFYQRDNVQQVARELLWKVLVTNFWGKRAAGMIVEVEAYEWEVDKASHAYKNRRTDRTEPMFWEGGNTYVYLCYGIHHLFNVVTHKKNIPHAILIRGIEPLEWVEMMMKRRNKKILSPTLTAWPGALAQAMGITTRCTNMSLQWPDIWIEDRWIIISPHDIIASSRVWVAYAEEHAKWPYRFSVKWNPFVSKAKWL